MTEIPQIELALKVVILVSVLLGFVAIGLFKKIRALSKDKTKLEEQFKDVIDIEKECEAVRNQLQEDKENLLSEQKTLENAISKTKSDYSEKKSIYDKLVRQVAIYNDEIQLVELGFYEPQFPFDSSERYKQAIKECKDEQKVFARCKTKYGAIHCYKEWTVEGSRAEGRKMTNRSIRLTARAFNNECDAAIANCRWNNVNKMAERIKKAFDVINDLNEPNVIVISQKYLNLKIKELYLTYEYHDKKQKEKEEQAEIRAQMREEAKREAELNKAQEEAAKEEKRYSKALEKARAEAKTASGVKLAVLEEQITQLQQELGEAEAKKERAKSMAEQTRQGHVYIISNIGSFGDHVYKIGMTRRLEPMDRVKELGDASVPFTFDVHAMIHTDDAPALEKALHAKFDSKRLNLVNRRKEFFNVTLGEIKDVVYDHLDDVDFVETAVARDYVESVAIRAKETVINDEFEFEFAESI
ncbi:DUF4041 domain-containing protein [Photobacterium sagamiensis]|uniref:DUF4041 domain-containing protein n=1 Tax=Photobacterium sagamiensis TaxID=2910241 RepID=UPI003D0C0BC9